jgi:ribose 5-phosphate isomerase A
MTWISQAKIRAAEKAVQHLKDGMIVGLGSGTTTTYAIRILGEKIRNGELNGLHGVPTSSQIAQEAINEGIRLTTLDEYPELDVGIDGADQIDNQLNAVKGGGGALLREKIVAEACREYIIITDKRKKTEILGQNQAIPLEIHPFALNPIQNCLTKLGALTKVRQGTGKLGPVITDNGNYIIDANFGEIKEPLSLDRCLHVIPGLLETGLFLGLADIAYIGTENSVEDIIKKK